MHNLQSAFELLPRYVHNDRAIDVAHDLFLLGAALSRKPRRLLELGIGTSFVTFTLLHALRYNGVGDLTCVDNFSDWDGRPPAGVERLRAAGVRVVGPMNEEVFLRSAADDSFDFVVADADHYRCQNWMEEYFRVATHDAFLFFHDTNNDEFPNLRAIVERVRDWKLPHYHFVESSRPDERCQRGLLFVINRKPLAG